MSEIDPKLSRAYREAATEEPPAALDAAILAAAREHAARPRAREGSSWWRWMAPASAIATLALGVSIALLVEREQPATLDETAARPAAPQAQGAAPAAEAAKAKTADSAAQAMKREAPAAESAAPAPTPMPAAPAPLPMQAPAPSAAAPAPAATRAEPAPRRDAPAAQAFPAESRERSAEPKLAAPKAEADANLARDSAPSTLGAGAAGAPAGAGRLAPLQQKAAPRSAQAWLDEISRLKREGREREAAEQLAEFRKAYPDYRLPADLLSK